MAAHRKTTRLAWLMTAQLVLLGGGGQVWARAADPPTSRSSWRHPPSFAVPRLHEQGGPRPPWPRRQRAGVKMRAKGQGLVDLSRWPAERPSPASVDLDRLARALRQLCGWMPPGRPLRWAGYLVRYGAEFGVDPFLLGGLVYRQSACLHRSEDSYGTGLLRINQPMHRPFIRNGRYRYWIRGASGWRGQELNIGRFPFSRHSLRRAEPSIYFAAALLSIYALQCPAIDAAFGSVPHRHHVSHLIWGDRVRDAGPEDRALRARRRLLQYYHDQLPAPRGDFEELALHCPLDGPPLKITSAMGADRDQGRRQHRGIDFSSSWGEPVRAVADGVVLKAGVNLRQAPSRNLPPGKARAVPRSRLGAGGLFVMLRHDRGLVSAYMHLSSYTVEQGAQVRGGQVIGFVGRSGISESVAHLHFELRHRGQHIDPAPHLAPFVFMPDDTYLGRKLAWEEARQRRRRQIQRRRERDAARR